MAIKPEKNCKYYRKCSNNFAADCIFKVYVQCFKLVRTKERSSMHFEIIKLSFENLLVHLMCTSCFKINPVIVNHLLIQVKLQLNNTPPQRKRYSWNGLSETRFACKICNYLYFWLFITDALKSKLVPFFTYLKSSF